MKNKPKTISVSEFKAKCQQILDELGPEGIVIEKRGEPIAKVIPIGDEDDLSVIGSMKGLITISGDTFTTGTKWDAES
ncbi:MAG: type II toxin-antitoxin system Phd/YefM family antitoxin [Acidobacteria bacterium]|nr:type II toxin-antitoxin system Phd/YefM family antitoxin [Acidobacteriota bacterium]MBK8149518.1 type II toxin-antitoxin system Phd/YefM family antitoxin [Acidobacteriota bacterium]MBK8813734.1 type II toxin-antitoxin system Phd/YefM family antitoxin [Acidobacteriota bacterium]